jgi:serine/threonine protein phosphatase PrpC
MIELLLQLESSCMSDSYSDSGDISTNSSISISATTSSTISLSLSSSAYDSDVDISCDSTDSYDKDDVKSKIEWQVKEDNYAAAILQQRASQDRICYYHHEKWIVLAVFDGHGKPNYNSTNVSEKASIYLQNLLEDHGAVPPQPLELIHNLENRFCDVPDGSTVSIAVIRPNGETNIAYLGDSPIFVKNGKTVRIVSANDKNGDKLYYHGFNGPNHDSLERIRSLCHDLSDEGFESWINRYDSYPKLDIKKSRIRIGRFLSMSLFGSIGHYSKPCVGSPVTVSIKLKKEDTLIMTSDGFSDRFRGEKESYYDRVCQGIVEVLKPLKSSVKPCDKVLALMKHKLSSYNDDISIIVYNQRK